MRWLVLLLLVPAAMGDVAISHTGDGPLTTAFAVRDDAGTILTHQNVELELRVPGMNMTSATMHDHDAFFWMLSQPADAGPVEAGVEAAGASGASAMTYAPAGGDPAGQWSIDDAGMLHLDGQGKAFYRLLSDGRLTAWGTRDLDGMTPIATIPVGLHVSAEAIVMAGTRAIETSSVFDRRETAQTIPALPAILDDPDQAPAPCMDVRQEPEGDWYVDTHVRLSIDPGRRVDSPSPSTTTYTLRGEDALSVTVDDPYGHAVLRALRPGAHTLTVDQDGSACELAINVLASEGAIEADWEVAASADGFQIRFDTASDAHYDVDGIIRAPDGRLLYAGKIHSHSTGTSATFQVPPGTYDIHMFPVAQGPGPSVTPLTTTVTVDGVEAPPAQATPMPWLLVIAALLVARPPQRL